MELTLIRENDGNVLPSFWMTCRCDWMKATSKCTMMWPTKFQTGGPWVGGTIKLPDLFACKWRAHWKCRYGAIAWRQDEGLLGNQQWLRVTVSIFYSRERGSSLTTSSCFFNHACFPSVDGSLTMTPLWTLPQTKLIICTVLSVVQSKNMIYLIWMAEVVLFYLNQLCERPDINPQAWKYDPCI